MAEVAGRIVGLGTHRARVLRVTISGCSWELLGTEEFIVQEVPTVDYRGASGGGENLRTYCLLALP